MNRRPDRPLKVAAQPDLQQPKPARFNQELLQIGATGRGGRGVVIARASPTRARLRRAPT
jgi:hypothetical protein